MAGEAGNAAAIEACGLLLIKKGAVQEGIEFLNQASDAGMVNASLHLGDIEYFGDYGDPNFDEALKHYRRAAEDESGYAAMKLGVIYGEGLSKVGQDADAACHWFEIARSRGEVRASSEIGWLVLTGKCGPVDWEKSIELFHEGAEVGDLAAIGGLSYLYSSDLWPSVDPKKGYYWSLIGREVGFEQADKFVAACEPALSSEEQETIKTQAEAFLRSIRGH